MKSKALLFPATVVAAAVAFGALLGAAVTLVPIPHRFGDLATTESAFALTTPTVSDTQARAAALTALSALQSSSSHPAKFTISESHYSPGLTKASDSAGGNLGFATQRPVNAYVVEAIGSGDQVYRFVKALVIVDASTGRVSSAQIARWN